MNITLQATLPYGEPSLDALDPSFTQCGVYIRSRGCCLWVAMARWWLVDIPSACIPLELHLACRVAIWDKVCLSGCMILSLKQLLGIVVEIRTVKEACSPLVCIAPGRNLWQSRYAVCYASLRLRHAMLIDCQQICPTYGKSGTYDVLPV